MRDGQARKEIAELRSRFENFFYRVWADNQLSDDAFRLLGLDLEGPDPKRWVKRVGETPMACKSKGSKKMSSKKGKK